MRHLALPKLFLVILSVLTLTVAVACGGDAATPTSPPKATATAKPAATAQVAPAATATAVPETKADMRVDYVKYLTQHPGYQAEWGEPQYGGIVRLSGPARVTSFHTGMSGWSAFINLSFASYNSMLMYDPWLDPGAGVLCDLCETWELSEDGKTLTYVIRDDIQFQSEGWGKDLGAPGFGEELVCKDVKASLEWYALPPEAQTAGAKAQGRDILGHMSSVDCPDGATGKTVVVNFDKFRNFTIGKLAIGNAVWNSEYRAWMDSEYPGIQASSKEEGYLINMGTGPQIPVSANGEVVLKTRTNSNYWIDGAPLVDGYEFFPILDYNTKFTSWVTGKIDHLGMGSSGMTKAQVVQAQQRYPDYKIHVVGYNHISQLPMNPFRAPFDQWKVRYAVHLAMDRGAWYEFNKAGSLEMAHPNYYFHYSSPWSIPEEEFKHFPGWRLDKKDEDIAEANRLLDEVFGPGLRPTDTEMTIWTLLSRREIGVFALEQFKQSLNWELDAKYVEVGEWAKKRTESTFVIQPDAAPMHGMCCIVDPSEAFNSAHSEAGLRPDAYVQGWSGTDDGKEIQPELDRIDALIEELDTSKDQARRKELSDYLQKYMIEERTTGVFLAAMQVAWGSAPRLRGTYFNHLQSYSEQRLYDRWWINEG